MQCNACDQHHPLAALAALAAWIRTSCCANAAGNLVWWEESAQDNLEVTCRLKENERKGKRVFAFADLPCTSLPWKFHPSLILLSLAPIASLLAMRCRKVFPLPPLFPREPVLA